MCQDGYNLVVMKSAAMDRTSDLALSSSFYGPSPVGKTSVASSDETSTGISAVLSKFRELFDELASVGSQLGKRRN